MYCVGVFALVGISVLEAMLVTFLIDLDCYCGKKAQSSVNASEDIQLQTGDVTGMCLESFFAKKLTQRSVRMRNTSCSCFAVFLLFYFGNGFHFLSPGALFPASFFQPLIP